jgi:hypothetical protein
MALPVGYVIKETIINNFVNIDFFEITRTSVNSIATNPL